MKNWDWIIGVNGIDPHGHRFNVFVTVGDIVACLIPLALALVLAAAWWVIRRKRR
jgi:hypothetical protein